MSSETGSGRSRRIGLPLSASGYQTDPPAASFRQRPPIRSRYSVCQRTIFTLIGLHTFDAFTASALPFRSRAARSFNTMTRTGFMNRPIHYRNRVYHRPRSGTCNRGADHTFIDFECEGSA